MDVPSGNAVKKQSWERAVGATLPPALLHEYFICNLLVAKISFQCLVSTLRGDIINIPIFFCGLVDRRDAIFEWGATHRPPLTEGSTG